MHENNVIDVALFEAQCIYIVAQPCTGERQHVRCKGSANFGGLLPSDLLQGGMSITGAVRCCLVQEVRLEDCSSQARSVEVPWEATMRMMPPLLELMDMVRLVTYAHLQAHLLMISSAHQIHREIGLHRCQGSMVSIWFFSLTCYPGWPIVRYTVLMSRSKQATQYA